MSGSHEKDTEKVSQTSSSAGLDPLSHVTVIEIGGSLSEPIEDNVSSSNRIVKSETTLTAEQELELFLSIENQEREKIIEQLNVAIDKERKSVERLQELLAETTK